MSWLSMLRVALYWVLALVLAYRAYPIAVMMGHNGTRFLAVVSQLSMAVVFMQLGITVLADILGFDFDLARDLLTPSLVVAVALSAASIYTERKKLRE